MKKIFSDYGIMIFKDGGRFILRYDRGEITVQLAEIVITQADAIAARQSAKAARDVMIKYQNQEIESKKTDF